MAVFVFPTVNDVGGGGYGEYFTEAMLAAIFASFFNNNWVKTGFTPFGSTGLTLNVPLGVAYIDGYRVRSDATMTLVLPPNVTSTIWLQITYDTGGRCNGAQVVYGAADPGNAVKLGTATTNAVAVTGQADKRPTITNLITVPA
jgi:hypothetical protein